MRYFCLHVPLSLYGVPLSGPTLEQPINVYCIGVLRVLFKFFCGSSGTSPGDGLLLISADSLIAGLSTYIYPAILSPLPIQRNCWPVHVYLSGNPLSSTQARGIAGLSTYIYPAILSPLPELEELLTCPHIFIQQSSLLYPGQRNCCRVHIYLSSNLSPLPRLEELLACPHIFIQQSSLLYPGQRNCWPVLYIIIQQFSLLYPAGNTQKYRCCLKSSLLFVYLF